MRLQKLLPIFYLLLPGCLLLTASCRKNNKPESSTPVVKWEQVAGISNGPGLMNSAFQNNRLNVWGSSNYYPAVALSPTGTSSGFTTGIFQGSGRLRFPVADRYFAFTNNRQVVIRSALTTPANSVERIVDLGALDPDFSTLADIPYWQGEAMGISANHFLLIPYRAVHNGVGIPTPYFALIGLRPPQHSDSELQVSSVNLIRRNLFPGEVALTAISSFGNFFFVNMGNATYRIDTQGIMNKVADVTLNIYQKGSNLYGFSANLNTDQADYYQSGDNGQSWQRVGGIAVGALATLHYSVIGEQVIGYSNNQLFLFETNGSTFSVRELENEGLPPADITSVTLSGTDTVFLTMHANSFTSLSGAYYKPLAHLPDQKKK